MSPPDFPILGLASPAGSEVRWKFRFPRYFASDTVSLRGSKPLQCGPGRPEILPVPEKPAQGSGPFHRAAKLLMLNSAGSSKRSASFQDSGTDTGAWGFRRTEYGLTTVCTEPLRNGSIDVQFAKFRDNRGISVASIDRIPRNQRYVAGFLVGQHPYTVVFL